jgi:phosphoglycolate phosphatase
VTLIALDLDGTLEDSRNDMVSAVHRLRFQMELPPRPDKLVKPNVNGGMLTLYVNCFDDFIGDDDSGERIAIVRERYEAVYRVHIADNTRLYPGMLDALSQLAQLGTLAVVTNKPEALSRELLNTLDVAHFFGAIIGGDTCASGKPDPVMLAVATERCGMRPETTQTFMIGDTANDIRMGRAFGATTIWCAWGYLKAPGDQIPHQIAETPNDLPRLISSELEEIS